jgi:hypothetical protein
MVQAFSVEELNSLCLDVQEKLAEKNISLKVNLDIVGGTSKEGKIINLITYLDNRGFLSLLVEAVKEERPNLL